MPVNGVIKAVPYAFLTNFTKSRAFTISVRTAQNLEQFPVNNLIGTDKGIYVYDGDVVRIVCEQPVLASTAICDVKVNQSSTLTKVSEIGFTAAGQRIIEATLTVGGTEANTTYSATTTRSDNWL